MPKVFFEEYDARMVFKENLQRILSEKHIDQTELAHKLGRAKSIVSDWYNGKKYPRVDAMQQIANVCEVTVEELISRPEDIWHSKLSRAYERASINQREKACGALGIGYIRVCDDRELVYYTRYYFDLAISGRITFNNVADIISAEYLKSQNSRWKHCTLETYTTCLNAITSRNLALLDGVRFDDEYSDVESYDNAPPLSTIAEITNKMAVPSINRSIVQSRSSDPKKDASNVD